MLDTFLTIGRKIIPRPLFRALQPIYHFTLAWFAAAFYWFPSRHLTIIGVTGTNGKSTVVELLYHIFEEDGFSTASISSLHFRMQEREWRNDLKMTMPGRFSIQRFLWEARRKGCRIVILEITSEGIKQFRHKFIKFRAAVLTNMTPEHIESHGSFEKYREAKAKLFKNSSIHILNSDEENLEYFKKIPAKERVFYCAKDFPKDIALKLRGEFNKANAMAALTTAEVFGVKRENIKKALENIENIPGRLEFVQRKPFAVVIDYAHTPDALRKVYQVLREREASTPSENTVPSSPANTTHPHQLICVFGAAGGGRDKWKRPELGKIAAEFCDEVFLTNEDPYDENPQAIIEDIEHGLLRGARIINYKKILDRKEAIQTAITDAKNGDTVIITGKGSEPWLMMEHGKKIPWDDREVARQAFRT